MRYGFINDISVGPIEPLIEDNWNIINSLLKLAEELRSYGITKIRTPKSIISSPIASSKSIADYLNLGKDFDSDKRTLLTSFIANSVDDRPREISEIFEEKEGNKLIDVYLEDTSSALLCEAHLIKRPVLSFQTKDGFMVNNLPAKFTVYYDSGLFSEENIQLQNLYSNNCIESNQEYLIEIKRQIVFTKTSWKPKEKPIWNDKTADMLISIEFPKSVKGKIDKKVELREVGTMVAEMNSWVLDEVVTNKNKSKKKLRQIFRSLNGSNTWYLSIDFEGTYGRFEVHNSRGIHQGEIDYTGKYVENADTSGQHDIKV